jgi:sugar diacid utilization regulator
MRNTRSVLIDSAGFEVLAAAQFGPVDESRERAVKAGRTPPEVVQRMVKRGIYSEIQQQMRHVRVPAMPDLGMSMERVVAPVVVGGEIYGYIWVVAGDHPLTELDELAIDNAATIAALVLLKEQAVRDAQQAVRGDFLAQLLNLSGEPDSPMLEQAHLVGYQLDQSHQVLFVMASPLTAGAIAQVAEQVEKILHRRGEWALVVTREHGVAVIVEARTNTAGLAVAEHLAGQISQVARAVVGVGRVHPEELALRRSYQEAVEAVEIGHRLGHTAVICFWELGLLDWLYQLPPEVLVENDYLAKIRVLAEHDRRSHSELVETLEAYLEHGGALSEAASALTVHRNTLLYRLGRIESIADVNLKDVRQRLNLHVALKGYRLLPGHNHP